MVIRIDKHETFQRLKNRFLLEFFGITPQIGMEENIRGVTNVDKLLADNKSMYASKDITAGGAAEEAYFTCPKGKRWEVKHAWRKATTGSSQIFVDDVSDQQTSYLTLYGTSEGMYTGGITMEEGDIMGLLTTGNGADGAISMTAMVAEEDAY